MFMQRVLKPLQSIHRGGCEGQHALPPPNASEFKTATHPPKKCCLLGFPLVWCSCSACSCHYNHYTRGDGGGGVLKWLFVRGNMGEGILGGKSQKMSSVWVTSPLEVPSITCCPPYHPSGRGPGHARTLVGRRAPNPNAQQYQIQRCIAVTTEAPPQRQYANTHLQIGG